MTLPAPDPPLLHHANYTIGLANKLAQLRYVRDVVDQRSELGMAARRDA
jgi:hypothetical protein